MDDKQMKIKAMAESGEVQKALDEALKFAHEKSSVEVWLLCAELANKLQRLSDAINYNHNVLEIDPENRAAQTNIEMLNSILNFRHKDRYNP